MNQEQIQELAAGYSLGALDDADRVAFEELLQQGDATALQAAAEMQEVASLLALTAGAITPPARTKAAILSRIAAEDPGRASAGVETPRQAARPGLLESLQARLARWRYTAIGVGFAALVLLSSSAAYIWTLRQEVSSLNRQLEIGYQLIENLRDEVAQKEHILKAMNAPQARVIALSAPANAPAPQASGKVIFDPAAQKAIFLASHLQKPPADRDYQIWMFRGKQPVDAGLLKIDQEGNFFAEFSTIPESSQLAAFALTLEPKGGVPQPTGALYLLGAVSGS